MRTEGVSSHDLGGLASRRPIGACRPFGLGAQFALPTGWPGRLVGQVMAIKNRRMNEQAIDVLAIQPHDRVLEIGFGPGTALGTMAERARRGVVVGVDPSEVMRRQAAARNRKLMDQGRVTLWPGTASDLPCQAASFDKVIAINSFHHWSDQEQDLLEVHRVLVSGGLLVLGLRTKHPTRTRLVAPGFTDEEIEEIGGLVRWVGFRDVRVERRQAGREVAWLMARA